MNLFNFIFLPISIFAVYIFSQFIEIWATRIFNTNKNQDQTFLVVTIKWIFVSICATSILATIGVDVSALIAGFGITGFALSFAFKDSLSNGVAGAMLLFYKPFSIGQEISCELPSTKTIIIGKVRKIDLRYTTVENEKEYILIPNSTLIVNPISIKK